MKTSDNNIFANPNLNLNALYISVFWADILENNNGYVEGKNQYALT